MKVMVTLDRFDGAESKSRIVQLEEVTPSQLMFWMMEAGVSGVSITKAEPLRDLIRKAAPSRVAP